MTTEKIFLESHVTNGNKEKRILFYAMNISYTYGIKRALM